MNVFNNKRHPAYFQRRVSSYNCFSFQNYYYGSINSYWKCKTLSREKQRKGTWARSSEKEIRRFEMKVSNLEKNKARLLKQRLYKREYRKRMKDQPLSVSDSFEEGLTQRSSHMKLEKLKSHFLEGQGRGMLLFQVWQKSFSCVYYLNIHKVIEVSMQFSLRRVWTRVFLRSLTYHQILMTLSKKSRVIPIAKTVWTRNVTIVNYRRKLLKAERSRPII